MNDRVRLAKYVKSTHQWRVLIGLVSKHRWTRGAELGVLRGKTLFRLLEGCPWLSMIAVDQWKTVELRDVPCAETYSHFDMNGLRQSVINTANRLYKDRCQVLVGDTSLMASNVEDQSLDFVFIDGDHTSEGVSRDIKAWAPKVKTGGMILGHDLSWPTVNEVINDLCPGWKDYGQEVWGVYKS